MGLVYASLACQTLSTWPVMHVWLCHAWKVERVQAKLLIPQGGEQNKYMYLQRALALCVHKFLKIGGVSLTDLPELCLGLPELCLGLLELCLLHT